jgi:NAD-dependent SIR2 family protein deacetylase
MDLKNVAGYVRSADQISIIIGAGASRTAGIPTAPLLIKKVQEEFAHCLGELLEDQRENYGCVMGALAPGDRKLLIQPLLENSKINWGHIALACIVRSANVRRILTFNFDLLLERSAALVGVHLPVYDFRVAPTRDLSGLAAPAIFHLHGQSYGLRLMNSDAETAQHKEALRPLLADSLRNHLIIVVGYSGEADSAFSVMEEEFNSHKNLIWLGFEEEPKEHLRGLLSKDYVHYIGGCDFDTSMIDIAEKLGCWPPEVMKNPPAHILAELSTVVDYPAKAEEGRSPYIYSPETAGSF